jgi:ABC-type dipeptide/oligopeptide/nickel transport system permease subunit
MASLTRGTSPAAGGLEAEFGATRTAVRPWLSRLVRRAARHRAGVAGAVLLGVLLVAALGGPWIAPYDADRPFVRRLLDGPSADFWFGNDQIGRDVLSRIVVGARATVVVGLAATAVAAVLGTPLGLAAGYCRGWVDLLAVYVVDVVLCFPALLLAMALVGVLGPGAANIAVAIGLASFPSFARLARGSALALRDTPFVEAARSLGAPHARIVVRHIWPNALPPLIVEAALVFGFAVAAEAALSFLGIGLRPPAPTWGGMVRDGLPLLRTAPHLVVFPSAAIFLTILGANLLGDGIRDALDPRLRQGR